MSNSELAKQVMERLDAKGKVIGFSIMGVSRFKKEKPLTAEFLPAA